MMIAELGIDRVLAFVNARDDVRAMAADMPASDRCPCSCPTVRVPRHEAVYPKAS